MDKDRMLYILATFQSLVGLEGYTISLTESPHDNDGAAEVKSNIYEKTLDIDLKKKFYELDDKGQRNVLIHELVHARVEISQLHARVLIEHTEELLVNDIVRGLELLEPDLQ